MDLAKLSTQQLITLMREITIQLERRLSAHKPPLLAAAPVQAAAPTTVTVADGTITKLAEKLRPLFERPEFIELTARPGRVVISRRLGGGRLTELCLLETGKEPVFHLHHNPPPNPYMNQTRHQQLLMEVLEEVLALQVPVELCLSPRQNRRR